MRKIGMVIDMIELIDGSSDSSPTLAEAIIKRGWEIYYLQQQDISLQNNTPIANVQRMHVLDFEKTSLKPTIKRGQKHLAKILNQKKWYQLEEPQLMPLAELDAVLVRKDPPFKLDYLHLTYLLDFVEAAGVLLVNSPRAIRETNDKLYIYHHTQCAPDSVVTADFKLFTDFLRKHQQIVCKPMDGTRGDSVFFVSLDSPNTNVIFETLTKNGKKHVVCQRYISEVNKGDKRIFLIDGKPVPYALARVPTGGEFRANLAAGGTPKGVKLSERDYWICEQIGPTLQKSGLLFVGIDVIGDFLTEINVVNLACTREINTIFNVNIDEMFLDCIEKHIIHKNPRSLGGS